MTNGLADGMSHSRPSSHMNVKTNPSTWWARNEIIQHGWPETNMANQHGRPDMMSSNMAKWKKLQGGNFSSLHLLINNDTDNYNHQISPTMMVIR